QHEIATMQMTAIDPAAGFLGELVEAGPSVRFLFCDSCPCRRATSTTRHSRLGSWHANRRVGSSRALACLCAIFRPFDCTTTSVAQNRRLAKPTQPLGAARRHGRVPWRERHTLVFVFGPCCFALVFSFSNGKGLASLTLSSSPASAGLFFAHS